MQDDINLLPLPEWMSHYTIPADGFECDKNVMLVDRMRDYARANVAVATTTLQAEIEALRAEVDGTIRELLAERDRLAAAIEAAQMGLRYAVRVWVLSDEIVWSEEEIDEAVERIIGDAMRRTSGSSTA